MKHRAYDASSISVPTQMEGVRSNPGMYLGDVDANGTLQCVREILANATDELEECGGGCIKVDIDANSVTIADEGRGIPVEVHPKTGKSTLETVLTYMHAGGKSGKKTAYGARTFGVHGVGASVVNALSIKFTAWSFRSNKWWRIDFSKGLVTAPLKKSKPPFAWECGTIIRYELDQSILKESLNNLHVRQLCDIARHFHPVDISYQDDDTKLSMKRRQPDRLLDRQIKEDMVVIPPVSFNINGVRLVCCWTNAVDVSINGHVSGAPVQSGTHIKGLEEALTEAIQSASPREAKGVENPLIGLRALLDVTVDQPSFSGQAKTVLKTSSARKQVVDAIVSPMIVYLKKHRTNLTTMLEHAANISAIDKESAEKKKLGKEVATGKGRFTFPKGAVVALNFPPERRELFLVEGDSAAGSLESAKLPWQEILPLRGKISNVINRKKAASDSEPVKNILKMVGYDPRNPTSYRVGKVIIMTDADEDGNHIFVLLLSVIQIIMPQLIKEGRLYIVEPPLFQAHKTNGDMVAGDVLTDMEKKYGRLHSVNRMKGLGGCEIPLLRRIATDPETRNICRLSIPTANEIVGLKNLMGGESSTRKKLLQNASKE